MCGSWLLHWDGNSKAKQVLPSSLHFLEKSVSDGTTLPSVCILIPRRGPEGFPFHWQLLQASLWSRCIGQRYFLGFFPPLLSRRGISKLFSIKGQMASIFSFPGHTASEPAACCTAAARNSPGPGVRTGCGCLPIKLRLRATVSGSLLWDFGAKMSHFSDRSGTWWYNKSKLEYHLLIIAHSVNCELGVVLVTVGREERRPCKNWPGVRGGLLLGQAPDGPQSLLPAPQGTWEKTKKSQT